VGCRSADKPNGSPLPLRKASASLRFVWSASRLSYRRSWWCFERGNRTIRFEAFSATPTDFLSAPRVSMTFSAMALESAGLPGQTHRM
jgi:hypothetical protein